MLHSFCISFYIYKTDDGFKLYGSYCCTYL